MGYTADKCPLKTVGDVEVFYLAAAGGEQGGHEVRFSDGWRIRALPEAPTPTTSAQKRSRTLTEALTALAIRTPSMIQPGAPSRLFVKAYLQANGVENVMVLAPGQDPDDPNHPVNEVRLVGTVTQVGEDNAVVTVRDGHDVFQFRVVSEYAEAAGVTVTVGDVVAITGRLVRRATSTPAGVRWQVLIEPRVVTNRTTGEVTVR